MNIDFIEKLCSTWPGVTTDVKWGNDLVFSVAEKMFCVSSMEQPPRIAFKVKDEEFEELSVQDGFQPAPYMARSKWVLVTNPGKLNRKEWEDFVQQSYELVKSKLPKKLQDTLSRKSPGTNQKPKETPAAKRKPPAKKQAKKSK